MRLHALSPLYQRHEVSLTWEHAIPQGNGLTIGSFTSNDNYILYWCITVAFSKGQQALVSHLHE